MSVLISTLGVVLALCAGCVLDAEVIRIPQTEFHQRYPLGPNGRVMIQNLYGDVRITAWDSDDVLVEAIKRGGDPKRPEDARIVVEPGSGQLSIHTQYAGADAQHPASVEYHVMVPRMANLEEVRLINGGISITGIAGPVRASSVNGSIVADRLEGQAELSTVNGTLDAAFERVDRFNPISLSSVNGAIRLSIPQGANASLVASNLSGGIESDVGHVHRNSGHHRLVVRGRGAPIQVRNVNGGISIHSNWGHASEHPSS